MTGRVIWKTFTLVIGVGCIALVLCANGVASTGDGMDQRSRAFVKQMHACDAAVSLSLDIVKGRPNDLIGASQTINTAKEICNTVRDRMATMDTRHFSDQALDGEVAVDYWSRGLGRFSNYIDAGRPSDVAKAAEYFGDARSASNVALRGINQRRAIYGLGQLR